MVDAHFLLHSDRGLRAMMRGTASLILVWVLLLALGVPAASGSTIANEGTPTPTPESIPSAYPTQTPENENVDDLRGKEDFSQLCRENAYGLFMSEYGDWIGGFCSYTDENISIESLVVQNTVTGQIWSVDYQWGTLPWDESEESAHATYPGIGHWSPDGKYLYYYLYVEMDGPYGFFEEANSVHRLDLKTGEVLTLLPGSPHLSHSYSFGFSPDGQWLAYTQYPDARMVHLRNLYTGKELLFTVQEKVTGAGWFQWSLNSQWLSFVTIIFDEEPEKKMESGYSYYDYEHIYSSAVYSMDTRKYQIILAKVHPYEYRWEGNKLIFSVKDTFRNSNIKEQDLYRYNPLTGERQLVHPVTRLLQ